MKTIKDFIETKLNKTEELPFETTILQFKKGQIIKQPREKEDRIYFLISGIIETGRIRNEENNIVEFFFPGEFFTDINSLITNKPTNGYVACITDCIIEVMPYDKLQEAYTTSSFANEFGRRLVEISLIHRIRKEVNMYKTAKQRYEDLVRKRPEIIQNIPVQKIAKYLGIDPNSLSRIRREIRDKE